MQMNMNVEVYLGTVRVLTRSQKAEALEALEVGL